MSKKITIIGGGLSGLLMAYRLKGKGATVFVIEARDRVGGRILTLESETTAPVEMGATWFHQGHHYLANLLQELKIPTFIQHMKGATFYEPTPGAPMQKIQLPQQAPSYRIAGGSGVLIQRLADQLSDRELFLNQQVESINFEKDGVVVRTKDREFEADQVICCLPPKLLVNRIQCQPELPSELIKVAQHTHTWMKDSAKVMLTYAKPFWREADLSGAIFSRTGAMIELYDHSNAELTKFALGGFLNPAYHQDSKEEQQEKVVAQLVSIFGSVAKGFLTYEDLNWANERYTTNPHSIDPQPHQNNGHPFYKRTWFDGRLIFAGAETSAEHCGKMEGAVASVEQSLDLLEI